MVLYRSQHLQALNLPGRPLIWPDPRQMPERFPSGSGLEDTPGGDPIAHF